jgi:hypothetical protein
MNSAFEQFLEAIRAVSLKREIDFEETPHYFRIIRRTCPNLVGVYCFVRKKDGAIFSPADFQRPRTGVNNIMGTIYKYEPVILGELGLNPRCLWRQARKALDERGRLEALAILVTMGGER